MTRAELQDHVVQALSQVAPEIDPSAIRADRPLRDQVDLDSMDFLRFLIELHRRLGVEIPETDYDNFTSLPRAVDYLAARLA
jgi:acyl carrier protein